MNLHEYIRYFKENANIFSPPQMNAHADKLMGKVQDAISRGENINVGVVRGQLMGFYQSAFSNAMSQYNASLIEEVRLVNLAGAAEFLAGAYERGFDVSRYVPTIDREMRETYRDITARDEMKELFIGMSFPQR